MNDSDQTRINRRETKPCEDDEITIEEAESEAQGVAFDESSISGLECIGESGEYVDDNQQHRPHAFPRQPFGHVPDDYLPAEATDDDVSEIRSSHHNKDLGKRGEDAAARFLKCKGFTILERNWTCPAGEADIIAERYSEEGCHEIHFIEVKTRTSTCTGFPEEAVNDEKRHRYEKIVEMYLRDHDIDEAMITFDVIALLVTRPNRAFMRMHTNVLLRDAW